MNDTITANNGETVKVVDGKFHCDVCDTDHAVEDLDYDFGACIDCVAVAMDHGMAMAEGNRY